MNEFKKWQYQKCETCVLRIPCDICKNLERRGWNAALKWVLGGEYSYDSPIDESIFDTIRKELPNNQTDNIPKQH